MYAKKEKPVVINTISLMWLTISALIFLWGFTFVDENPELALRCLGAALIGITGVVMIMITVGIKWQHEISMTQTIFLIGISCFATLMINAVTAEFAKFETTPMPRALFGVLLGNTEEILFRGWLQTWLLAFTGSLLVSVIFSSLIFGVFHGAVYGLNPEAIFVVIGCSVILGFVFEISGRQLHINQSSHGIINLLSYLGGKG